METAQNPKMMGVDGKEGMISISIKGLSKWVTIM
jgi:hypothetical protein